MTTRTILVVGALVVVLAFVGGIVLQKGRDSDASATPTPSPTVSVSPSATPTPTATPKPVTYNIRRGDNGIDPKTLTIRRGDTVVFINDAASGFWPASDPHPTHSLCPGFDARRALERGETYTLVFTTARTCTYHNHVVGNSTADQGTIIVK
jgi:plastocyanin